MSEPNFINDVLDRQLGLTQAILTSWNDASCPIVSIRTEVTETKGQNNVTSYSLHTTGSLQKRPWSSLSPEQVGPTQPKRSYVPNSDVDSDSDSDVSVELKSKRARIDVNDDESEDRVTVDEVESTIGEGQGSGQG